MNWVVVIVGGEYFIKWPEQGMFEEEKRREVFEPMQFCDNSKTHLVSIEVEGAKVSTWIYVDQIDSNKAKRLLEYIFKFDVKSIEKEIGHDV